MTGDPKIRCSSWSSGFGKGVRAEYDTPSGWRVTARVRATGGRPIITELSIESRKVDAAPGGGIDAAVLREIPVGAIYRAAGKWIAEQAETPFRVVAAASGFDMADPARKPRRPGPPPAPDAALLPYAVAYANAFARGERNPMVAAAAVAPRSSKNPMALARRAIRVARYDRDLLTSHGQGRAGGELTPKAIALLQEADRARKA